MIRNHCSRIGYISKPHGISGEVILRLEGFSADEINPGEPLFVETDGTLVPFFIISVRPAGDRAFLELEFIDSSEDADKLRGKPVYLENATPDDEQDTTSPEILKGWTLEDVNSGFSGIIEDVNTDTPNPLFSVVSGEKEYFVPAQDEFVVKVNRRKKIIFMELPEGLLDINE